MLSEDLPFSTISPLNYCTSAKGVFDDTTPAQMHEAMTAYQAVCSEQSLALFFHGGLVPKASGMSQAQQLVGPYSAATDPDAKAGNAYPYFFVWESGLAEVLEHNLSGIVAETIFQRIRDIVGAKAQAITNARATTPISPDSPDELDENTSNSVQPERHRPTPRRSVSLSQ